MRAQRLEQYLPALSFRTEKVTPQLLQYDTRPRSFALEHAVQRCWLCTTVENGEPHALRETVRG
jgi:hypothetical protein